MSCLAWCHGAKIDVTEKKQAIFLSVPSISVVITSMHSQRNSNPRHMMPLQTICSDASHPIPFIPLVVIEQAKKVVWDAAQFECGLFQYTDPSLSSVHCQALLPNTKKIFDRVYARNFDEINRKKMTVLCVCVYVYVCVFGDYLGCCRERTGACWGKGLWFSQKEMSQNVECKHVN